TNLTSLGERQSVEVEVIKLRLRPVVGAAMAIVVYVLGESHIAFELLDNATTASSAPIHIQVASIAWGYYALAFLAGFAERWFLQLVDITQSRFDPPRPAGPPTGGPPGGNPPGGNPPGGNPPDGNPPGGNPPGGNPPGGNPPGGTTPGAASGG